MNILVWLFTSTRTSMRRFMSTVLTKTSSQRVVRIVFSTIRGRKPLRGQALKDFRQLVGARADEIVDRWIDYFVLRRHSPVEVITRKLK